MARREKPSEQVTASAPKVPVKTAVTLSADAYRRLKTASLVDGKDHSEIMESLIVTNLVGYFAGRRGSSSESENGEAA